MQTNTFFVLAHFMSNFRRQQTQQKPQCALTRQTALVSVPQCALTRPEPLSSCVQGKGIGVGIGCVLGMFPLLFFKDDDKKKKKKEEEAAAAAAKEEAAKVGMAETQLPVLAEVGK